MRMQTKHRTPLTCGVAHVSIAIHAACVPTLRVFVHVAQHATSHNKLHRSWLAILNSILLFWSSILCVSALYVLSSCWSV